MRHFTAMFLCFVMLAMTVPGRAAEPEHATISTQGEATVYVVPDKVVVNLGVESFDIDLDKATAANEASAAKLILAIQGVGVEKKEIATDNLQVEIKRRYNDGHYLEIDGYIVRRGYSVTLKETKLFEKLVSTALKNGANQIQNVSFTTTELRKFRDQARQMAMKAAQEKAVLLAKTLDCAVGKPRTISEGAGYTYFGGYRWGGYGGGGMSQNSSQSMEGPPDTGENLPLGQIAVSASVSVTFEMQ